MYQNQVRIELTSADLAGRLRDLNAWGVTVEKLQQIDSLTVIFTMNRKDYQLYMQYFEKNGDQVKCLSFSGLGEHLKHMKSRLVLWTGILALIFSTLWIPSRVLFVQVKGNRDISAHQVLQSAQASGVYFGASVRQVRSEKVKNQLLADIPELQWVGVNTKGCVATITVSERDERKTAADHQEISSLVSTRDALVTQITVTQGNPMCKPGAIVREGQILISGYTDCGLKIQATNAKGEVFGYTIHDYQLVFPLEYQERGEYFGKTTSYSLLIGKKDIKISKDSGISGMVCDKMYTEKFLTLPGGFILPFGIRVETCTYWKPRAAPMDARQEYLEAMSKDLLLAGMISGEIISQVHTLEDRGDYLYLDSRYVCQEMIARIQYEEIKTHHEQNCGKDCERRQS